MNKKQKVSLFLVSIMLGSMLTVQFSTVKNRNKAVESNPGGDYMQLSTDLTQAKERQLFLYNQIAHLENQIEKYKQKKGDAQEIVKEMADELEKVKKEAGASEVKGSGLIVTIEESVQAKTTYTQQDLDFFGRILDQYLLASVNYLNGNGAYAISINDRRITSLSTIRSISSYNLQINSTTILTDVITIKAVGNVDQMKVGLLANEMPNGFNGIGRTVTIQEIKDGSLTVPTYNEPVKFNVAKPEGDKGL